MKGKKVKVEQGFKFSKCFSLSVNPRHFSDIEEFLKLLNKITVLYVEVRRKKVGLEMCKIH